MEICKFAKIGAFSVILGFASQVSAGGAAGSGLNPFSDCGIGAVLFPKHKVAAVISNIIWDIGTTAVTSAVSSPETCSGKDVVAAKFILDTYVAVEEETAAGKGEHLASAMALMGCDASQDSVIDSVQAHLSETLRDDNYANMSQVEKAESYYFGLKDAAQACGA